MRKQLRELLPVTIAFAVIITVYLALIVAFYGIDSIDYLTELLQ